MKSISRTESGWTTMRRAVSPSVSATLRVVGTGRDLNVVSTERCALQNREHDAFLAYSMVNGARMQKTKCEMGEVDVSVLRVRQTARLKSS
jgi:hypothetical protein